MSIGKAVLRREFYDVSRGWMSLRMFYRILQLYRRGASLRNGLVDEQ